MPPVPITSPIMNPGGDPQPQGLQQQPSASGPRSSHASFPQPHLAGGQPFHGIQQPLAQTGMPPSFSKPNTEGAPGAPIGNTIQVSADVQGVGDAWPAWPCSSSTVASKWQLHFKRLIASILMFNGTAKCKLFSIRVTYFRSVSVTTVFS